MNEESKNQELDFVALGDIVIDDFILLKEAEVIEKDGASKLCMTFADKIPYTEAIKVPAVGNSPNASVAAARLGLKSAIVTNMGDDENGQACLNSLKKDGVVTDFVSIQKDKKTNYHYVLVFNADRTILIKHTQFDYKLPNIGSPKWMYLSSLAENSLPYHKEVAEYLKLHPETKLAFQPGTFQITLGYENLKDIYELTEIFFCNVEEARRILKPVKGESVMTVEIKELMQMLMSLGPKNIVITDGPNGAYAYDGESMWHTSIYPDIAPPVERTGAGDAFSSTVTSALALGKSLQEALAWGPINSMSVVQEIGAQKGLLSRERLEKYLQEAPESYKLIKIN